MTLTLMTGFDISVLKTCSNRLVHCNLLFIMYLYQYAKVTINIFMYKYNLHSLASECALLPLLHPLLTSFYPSFTPRICQKYVKSETDLCLRRGIFSPLVEGVKLLPNPLFFASYLLKLQKLPIFIFCI